MIVDSPIQPYVLHSSTIFFPCNITIKTISNLDLLYDHYNVGYLTKRFIAHDETSKCVLPYS